MRDVVLLLACKTSVKVKMLLRYPALGKIELDVL